MDIRTHIRMNRRTFEKGFIRSTLSKSRPNKDATDTAHSVVCVLDTKLSCAKMAEPITMRTHVCPRNHAIDGVQIKRSHDGWQDGKLAMRPYAKLLEILIIIIICSSIVIIRNKFNLQWVKNYKWKLILKTEVMQRMSPTYIQSGHFPEKTAISSCLFDL